MGINLQSAAELGSGCGCDCFFSVHQDVKLVSSYSVFIVTAGPPGLSQCLLCPQLKFLLQAHSHADGLPAPRRSLPSVSTGLYPLHAWWPGVGEAWEQRLCCSGSASGTGNAPGPQGWAISVILPLLQGQGLSNSLGPDCVPACSVG